MQITTELLLTQAAAASPAFEPFNPALLKPKPVRSDINRANAASSTGPVTAEGKRASSQNSFKHGLTGLTFVLLPTEDAQVFADLTADLLSEYDPQSPVESHLVEKLAQHQWLSQRAMNFQASAFNEDGSTNDRRLSLSLRYINLHERLLRECLAELKRVQRDRKLQRISSALADPALPATPHGFVSHADLNAPSLVPPPPPPPSVPDPYYPLRTRKGIPPKTKRRR